MFRVKKTEMISKTFRMPLDLIKKLEVVAQKQEISLNNLITQCCEYAINSMEETDE